MQIPCDSSVVSIRKEDELSVAVHGPAIWPGLLNNDTLNQVHVRKEKKLFSYALAFSLFRNSIRINNQNSSRLAVSVMVTTSTCVRKFKVQLETTSAFWELETVRKIK